MTTSKDDPVDGLSLDDALDAAGDDALPEVRKKAATRLSQLATLSVASLERAMKRGHVQASIYVHRTIHHRGVNDTVTLPPGWAKAKTIAERAAIVDKLLAQERISPAQAKTLLGLGESVQLQRELDDLKKQIGQLQRSEQPAGKTGEPKRPSVKRVPPPEDGSDLA